MRINIGRGCMSPSTPCCVMKKLRQPRRLIRELYEAGADALIIQDTGLLELDLPPHAALRQHADAQPHPRAGRLPRKGGHPARHPGARAEPGADQAYPRQNAAWSWKPSSTARCASATAGSAAMSYALGGRSGNRGQCAQPCRRPYRLVDAAGSRAARGPLPALPARPEPLRGPGRAAGCRRALVQDRRPLERQDLRDERGGALPPEAGCVVRRKKAAPTSGRILRKSLFRFHAQPVQNLQPRVYQLFLPRAQESRWVPSIRPKPRENRPARWSSWRATPSPWMAALKSTAGDGLCFFNPQSELVGTTVNEVQGQPDRPRENGRPGARHAGLPQP